MILNLWSFHYHTKKNIFSFEKIGNGDGHCTAAMSPVLLTQHCRYLKSDCKNIGWIDYTLITQELLSDDYGNLYDDHLLSQTLQINIH